MILKKIYLILFLAITSFASSCFAMESESKAFNFDDIEDQNISAESNVSNFSDEFRELMPFHEFLGLKTHNGGDFQDLKLDYLQNKLGGFIISKLKPGTEFYKTLNEKKHTVKTIESILDEIHKIAIFAYDASELNKKSCDANSIGIYRHTFCESFLNKCKEVGFLKFLQIENSYKNKNEVARGTDGSVRPDVYWKDLGHVFDFKFLEADVKKPQYENWLTHLPLFKKHTVIGEN